MSKKIEFGDFQTPDIFANDVVNLIGKLIDKPSLVIEPTSGVGSFINAAFNLWGDQVQYRGYEINDEYYKSACSRFEKNESILVCKTDFFNTDWETIIKSEKNALVLGNPPWVTNSELGALSSDNVPTKRNLKNLNGLDAITGGSNFDIAESIWLKLIDELKDEEPTIAMLCKTSVARNIIEYASRGKLPIASALIRKIDAAKWFGASVDACLFVVEVSRNAHALSQVPVFRDLKSTSPEHVIGVLDRGLIADQRSYSEVRIVEGSFPFQWRQGLKHDAADVMELTWQRDGSLRNKLGEPVHIESDFVYPLLKSSDVAHARTTRIERAVIVTQTFVGESTTPLSTNAPRLWAYLQSHSQVFERRRSSIYQGKPVFSIFGIGPYSFAPFKVVVSGMYKSPKFVAIGPYGQRPVMMDDTCYFVPFESAMECAITATLLNSSPCRQFL
ncbi:MAG: SAM-dependent methyltransferase, partial [Leptospiraceae bacterium]|nr:SAM-dependent methyltransferase [Leptospiraceae bacterium]